jgi:hypothetical protein
MRFSAGNTGPSALRPNRIVIPSEAEGSAVLLLGKTTDDPQTELSSRPERSEVEGSAVLLPSTHSQWKRRPPICHPERSRGICSAPRMAPKASGSHTRSLAPAPPVGQISVIVEVISLGSVYFSPVPGRSPAGQMRRPKRPGEYPNNHMPRPSELFTNS